MWTSSMMMGVGKKDIEFVAAASNAVSGTNTISCDKPTGTGVGDFLVVFITLDTVGATATAPSGWTLVGSITAGDAGISDFIYTKTAGASEPANYTWFAGTSSRINIATLAYRYANATDVVGAFYQSNNNIATFGAPSLVATTPGALLAFYTIKGTNLVATAPSGMTQRALVEIGNISLVAFDLIPSPAGVTGEKAITWASAGRPNTAVQLQIK